MIDSDSKICHAELVSASLLKRFRNKFGMTTKKAFTLAEVLITLTIIGVIAALTIPNLIQAHNKKVVESSLKKQYAIWNTAISNAIRETGENIDEWNINGITTGYPEEYFNKYLSQYFKVTEIGKNKTLYSVRCRDGVTTIGFDGIRECFADGICASFRKENCGGSFGCFYVLVDINGKKGPNISGRDVFWFNVYPNTGDNGFHIGAYPIGSSVDTENSRNSARNSCKNDSSTAYSTAMSCSAVLFENGFKIPDDYPIKKF